MFQDKVYDTFPKDGSEFTAEEQFRKICPDAGKLNNRCIDWMDFLWCLRRLVAKRDIKYRIDDYGKKKYRIK